MVIFAGIMEYLSKERHDQIVAELKQLIDEAMYSHSLLLAAVAAALLLPACSRRDAARIDDGASARVEVLRSELKEGLATQDEDAIDSLAASLYRYGEHTQDPAVRLYGMVAKAQSFYLRAGQTDSVSKYLSQGEALARQEQDWWALATLCNIKGARQAFAEMDYGKAIGTLTEGMDYAMKCDDKSRLFPLESNLALAYYMRRDESGLPYALDVYRFGEENNHPFARYLGAVLSAYMYEMMGQCDSAGHYIDKVLDHVDYYGDQRGVYALYGDILSAKGDGEHAVMYYRKSLSEGEDSERFSDIDAHVGYASYLGRTGKVDSAVTLLQRALLISQHANRPSKSYLVYHSLAELYEKSGNYRQALDCYKHYHEEADSLFSMKKEREVSDMKMNYERERYENGLREHEMEELRWKHKFTAILICTVFILAFLVLGGVLYYRKNKRNIQMLKRFQEQLEDRQQKHKHGRAVGETNSREDKMRDLFERLQRLMQEQKPYRDPGLTREGVAERLQTNRTYLTEVIQRYTGLSFVHYMNSYRIEEAAAILSDPSVDTPIKAVASDLGFTSISTFYRLFQAIKGTSPSQYRKQFSN